MSEETLSVADEIENVLHETNESVLDEANQLQAEGRIGHAMDEASFVMGEIVKTFNDRQDGAGPTVDPHTWDLEGPRPDDAEALKLALLTARDKTLEAWRGGSL